eukprot:9202046-Karenia_brevis.AAC.1
MTTPVEAYVHQTEVTVFASEREILNLSDSTFASRNDQTKGAYACHIDPGSSMTNEASMPNVSDGTKSWNGNEMHMKSKVEIEPETTQLSQ